MDKRASAIKASIYKSVCFVCGKEYRHYAKKCSVGLCWGCRAKEQPKESHE